MKKLYGLFVVITCFSLLIPSVVGAQSVDAQLQQVEDSLAEVASQIGSEQLNTLVSDVQAMLDGKQVVELEQIKEAVLNEAEKMGISLTAEQQQILTNNMQMLQDLNVGWDGVKEQVTSAISQVEEFAQSEKGVTFFQEVLAGIKSIFDAVLALF